MTMPNNILNRACLCSGLAAALAFAAWVPGSVQAGPELKGAELMLQMQRINTRPQAEALKPDDSIAMVCAKCKSVTVEYITVEKGHIRHVTPGEKHLCPGCKSSIQVIGVGKQAKNEVKHVCTVCGDSSAFCCATKPGSGPTKGMEKK